MTSDQEYKVFYQDEDGYSEWRKNNPSGFIVHQKSKKSYVLHHRSCFHLIDPTSVLTAKPKITALTWTGLRAWAAEEKILLETVRRCKSCEKHITPE